MRKLFGIAVLCALVILGVVFIWRALPIEGETRSRFFAKGRAPREIRNIIDIDGLDFISFSKISDEAKVSYEIGFRKNPKFEMHSLTSNLAKNGWVFSHEFSSYGDQIYYFVGSDFNYSEKMIMKIHDYRVRFVYFRELDRGGPEWR